MKVERLGLIENNFKLKYLISFLLQRMSTLNVTTNKYFSSYILHI